MSVMGDSGSGQGCVCQSWVPGPTKAGLQQGGWGGVWVSPAFDVQHFRDGSEKSISFHISLPSFALLQGSYRFMSSVAVLWQESAAGGRALEHHWV